MSEPPRKVRFSPVELRSSAHWSGVPAEPVDDVCCRRLPAAHAMAAPRSLRRPAGRKQCLGQRRQGFRPGSRIVRSDTGPSSRSSARPSECRGPDAEPCPAGAAQGCSQCPRAASIPRSPCTKSSRRARRGADLHRRRRQPHKAPPCSAARSPGSGRVREGAANELCEALLRALQDRRPRDFVDSDITRLTPPLRVEATLHGWFSTPPSFIPAQMHHALVGL